MHDKALRKGAGQYSRRVAVGGLLVEEVVQPTGYRVMDSFLRSQVFEELGWAQELFVCVCGLALHEFLLQVF